MINSFKNNFIITYPSLCHHQIHALGAPLEWQLLLPVGSPVPLLPDAEGHVHDARAASAQRPSDGALAAR